jgi:hypothetical protein
MFDMSQFSFQHGILFCKLDVLGSSELLNSQSLAAGCALTLKFEMSYFKFNFTENVY